MENSYVNLKCNLIINNLDLFFAGLKKGFIKLWAFLNCGYPPLMSK